MLQCHAVGCTSNNFPLRLEELQIERDEVEVNAAFLVGLLPKLDWPALVATAEQLGFAGLPDTIPEEAETNEAFLEQLNSVLLEVSGIGGWGRWRGEKGDVDKTGHIPFPYTMRLISLKIHPLLIDAHPGGSNGM